MKCKGLTITCVFEAESANYGESIGNAAALKKHTRNDGNQYTYISRQAIRYNIIEQLEEPLSEVEASGKGDKKVIQFAPSATIESYPELDFFGYLKTEKGSDGKKRSAKVRLSHGVALEPFVGETDFLTNKGLADRLGENMNIAQSEIHKSFYRYTIAVDLDQIGIDHNDDIQLENTEKARRVKKLLDTVALLYRDIKGRREDLKPLFAIGGVYNTKNPIFQNIVMVKNGKIQIEAIESVMFSEFKEKTHAGVIEGIFKNNNEIKTALIATNMPLFFETLKTEIEDYYASC